MSRPDDGTASMSAQVSLYPLRCAELAPPIREALRIMREHHVSVEPGAMSTVISGNESDVFAAVQEAYRAAAAHAEIVLVATFSNACPVGPPQGEKSGSPGDITPRPVGIVRSTLDTREAARDEQRRGEPAVLEFNESCAAALEGLEAGDDVLVLYWMHALADHERTVLRVHPQGNLSLKKRGVFATRSPARPNPIGASRVRVVRIDASSLVVEGLDALDGSPVLDVKLERKAEK